VAHFPPDLLRAAAALLLLSLAAAGCAGGSADREPAQAAPTGPAAPPGFTADTFGPEGLASGARATEAGCRALADGLWVATRDGRRHECLRHAAAGMEERGAGPRRALVHIPGDAAGMAFRFAGGRPWAEAAGAGHAVSAEARRAAAEALSAAMGGMPVVLIGRPGMHGSSGDHARDRHSMAEVELVDAALTELRRRHGFRDLVLSGFSSGGAVVANLLARRTDIRCAVIASAPLDLDAFYRSRDGRVPDHYAMRGETLADPMRSVRAIPPGVAIFVLGDPRDRTVPASAWGGWVAAARQAGLSVSVEETSGLGPTGPDGADSHHRTSARALQVARACATGEPAPGEASGIRPAIVAPLLRAIE
jgi:dienelactone hydrolase